MRILGRIPHPTMQISVFSNDGRFPVQFEMSGLSQMYRFRKSENIKGLGDIMEILDEEFTTGILHNFETMRTLHKEVLQRAQPEEENNEDADLPDIF
jgi:hypothetical protein